MTLIITAIRDSEIVQVSDMRLTYSNRQVASEKAIKSICVDCVDSRFTVVYTGLASIENVNTDEWLVDYFASSNAPHKRLTDVIEGLRVYARESFSKLRSLGKRRGITIVISGFLADRKPFVVLLSNQEKGGKWLSNVQNDFNVDWLIRNTKRVSRLNLMVNGAESAIDKKLMDGIKKIRNKFFSIQHDKLVMVLVDIIKRASCHHNHGWTIGKSFISTVLDSSGNIVCRHHQEKVSTIAYMPHFVSANCKIKDIKVFSY